MGKIWITLLAVAITCMQCKKNKSTSTTNQDEVNTEQVDMKNGKPELRKIIADINYTWPGTTDDFNFISSEIQGDSLIVLVEYGGGCKDHLFAMHTNLHWMKSMPPQLNLYLEHENNDDNCRALIQERLVFDLSNCRYQPGNSVILILNGDREKRLQYNY